MLTSTFFPHSSIENEGIIPLGRNVQSLKTFSIVGDQVNVGESRPFQHVIDIMHVESPSSTTILHIAESS